MLLGDSVSLEAQHCAIQASNVVDAKHTTNLCANEEGFDPRSPTHPQPKPSAADYPIHLSSSGSSGVHAVPRFIRSGIRWQRVTDIHNSRALETPGTTTSKLSQFTQDIKTSEPARLPITSDLSTPTHPHLLDRRILIPQRRAFTGCTIRPSIKDNMAE